MKLNDKVYDILKWVSLVALDAIGVAYKGLALCWGWSYGDEVMTTCAIISVLIGTLIGVSSVAYHKEEAVAAKSEIDDALNAAIANLYLGEPDIPEESTEPVDDTGNIDGGDI